MGIKENNTLGKRIAELMSQQKMSQKELADKVGITQVSMSRYISGIRVPKGPMVAKLAKALHTTVDYLLDCEQESDDPEIEYNRVQRIVAKNACKWTPKQKADLVNMLFEIQT